MDKSRVCVTRTINLVQQAPCKKQNLLVYEKGKPECMPIQPKHVAYVVPPICNLPAKRIKVCTGRDLKKMCAPKLCECPEKKKVGFFGYLARLLGFGMKSAIAGGLVYLTYDMGIWGPSDNTSRLYSDFCHITTPKICPKSKLEEDEEDVKEESDYCKTQQRLMCARKPKPEVCSELPHIDGIIYRTKQLWNKMVVFIFCGIAYFPGNVITAVNDFRKYLEANKKKEPKCMKKDESSDVC